MKVFLLMWKGSKGRASRESRERANCRREPVFITKNGCSDLVVMSIETYETMAEAAETDAAIAQAEAEHEQDGQLFDARETLAALRR